MVSEAPRAFVRMKTLHGHFSQSPFDAAEVEQLLDLSQHVFLELRHKTRVYSLACGYIARQPDVQSLRYSPELLSGSVEENDLRTEATPTTIGLGFFEFQWKGHELSALHQMFGSPVGAGNAVDVFTNLVLFAKIGEAEALPLFCNELVQQSEQVQAGFINVFEWHPTQQYWQARVVCPARPMASIILDAGVKEKLLADLDEFLAPETQKWYKEHGIQHKRGYLFYGVPGSGKTSLVQAIAGHFQHNLCYVHLTHPNLTDESLRAAMNQAPRHSLLVFEDIDAIFGRDREKLLADSVLTFPGLLNALDGVGKADGQIFVMTTNHRDRLNPALIRNGRADLHVEFSYASDSQIAGMFARFYPGTEQRCQDFVTNLRHCLAGRPVTTAALQHFFILHRRSSALQALDSVQDVVEELEQRADEQRMSRVAGVALGTIDALSGLALGWDWEHCAASLLPVFCMEKSQLDYLHARSGGSVALEGEGLEIDSSATWNLLVLEQDFSERQCCDAMLQAFAQAYSVLLLHQEVDGHLAGLSRSLSREEHLVLFSFGGFFLSTVVGFLLLLLPCGHHCLGGTEKVKPEETPVIRRCNSKADDSIGIGVQVQAPPAVAMRAMPAVVCREDAAQVPETPPPVEHRKPDAQLEVDASCPTFEMDVVPAADVVEEVQAVPVHKEVVPAATPATGAETAGAAFPFPRGPSRPRRRRCGEAWTAEEAPKQRKAKARSLTAVLEVDEDEGAEEEEQIEEEQILEVEGQDQSGAQAVSDAEQNSNAQLCLAASATSADGPQQPECKLEEALPCQEGLMPPAQDVATSDGVEVVGTPSGKRQWADGPQKHMGLLCAHDDVFFLLVVHDINFAHIYADTVNSNINHHVFNAIDNPHSNNGDANANNNGDTNANNNGDTNANNNHNYLQQLLVFDNIDNLHSHGQPNNKPNFKYFQFE
ncbi:BCS1 [Symbiodinium microadriaticum]|nr:BCS1 [Symbiodinium microadriaticum]